MRREVKLKDRMYKDNDIRPLIMLSKCMWRDIYFPINNIEI